MTPREKAVLLILETQRAVANGTLHYRVSDGKLLKTPKEILKTLVKEGKVTLEPAIKT